MPVTPTSFPQPLLANAIYTALENAKKNGTDGMDPAQMNLTLANEIATAINSFVVGSIVTVTVAPGIAVTTAGSPSAQAGATISPGTGVS